MWSIIFAHVAENEKKRVEIDKKVNDLLSETIISGDRLRGANTANVMRVYAIPPSAERAAS